MYNEQDLIEKEKQSQLIYDGRVLHLYRDTVTLPNGHEDLREYCKHNGGVCVLPLTDDGDVICVHQYRYAHREITLEIPAGKLERTDTDIRAAALRELREETGAICQNLIYLGKMYPSPALMDEVIHMFLAMELEMGQSSPDEDEFIECERIPFTKMLEMALNGEIPDAKTQLAVLKTNAILQIKQ